MSYKLLDQNGKVYLSDVKGSLGGYKPKKIYGKLDCASANRALSKGGYAKHRVFFADEATAIAAGYRPCGMCCREDYASLESCEGGWLRRVLRCSTSPAIRLAL
jgi:hypothetical protein